MVRVGTVLAIFALALALLGGVSMFVPLCGVWTVTERASVVLSVFDGRVRVFWFTSEHVPIEVASIREGRGLSILPVAAADSPWAEVIRAHSPRGRGPVGAQISLSPRGAIAAFGGQWRGRLPVTGGVVPGAAAGPPMAEYSFVRMPVWLPVVLLLMQPIRAIIFGPWLWRRRERNHLCLACGYERIGLTEPRCPECGTPHSA